MSALTRSDRGSSNQLLYHVLEEPQLMAAVRELPAPVLVRLIHHVGLEDAGELIALTSTQQLDEVFDAELWQGVEPGSDELFRPERFALFLRLLYEAGETFVVERLLSMPRELLTLAVHKLVLVIDIDALTVRLASSGRFYDDSIDRVERAIDSAQFEEWEEFRLIARDPNAFEDVWNALLALDREDHELVRHVIERCCDMDGELIEDSGLYAVLNEEEMLESDIAAEREDRRAGLGFVAPADARAFLQLARRETIDEAPDGRDPIARAYFRQLSPKDSSPAGQPRLTRGDASGAPAGHAARPDVGKLLSVLRDAHVLDDKPTAASAPRRLDREGARVAPALRAPQTVVDPPAAARTTSAARPPAKASRQTAVDPPAAARTTSAARPPAKASRQTAVDPPAAARTTSAARPSAKVSRVRESDSPAQTTLSELDAAYGDLAGPPAGKPLTLMAMSMSLLRERDPRLHAQRTEELGFVANVLVAGSQHDGRSYRPVEAIECALATCSVGLEREHMLRVRGRVDTAREPSATGPTAAQACELLVELSADRLFRGGLHALHVHVGERARALAGKLLGISAGDVAAAASGAATSLAMQLGVESEHAASLAALAEPEPWLARGLAADGGGFIASHDDIERALVFLSAREREVAPE